MRNKLAAAALAGALGVTGVAAGALLAPAVSYAATGDSSPLESRVTALREALAGLVSDGTLTQAQADEVATTLAERGPSGHRGHGGGPGGPGLLPAAAEALGLTLEELRTAAQRGSTLAQLAEREGVSEDSLVDAMVSAAQEHLDEAVSANRLSRAQADERAAELEERIAASLDQPLRAHRGSRGHGRHDHGEPDGDAGPPAPAPSASAQGGDA